jgi:hypothetical protein
MHKSVVIMLTKQIIRWTDLICLCFHVSHSMQTILKLLQQSPVSHGCKVSAVALFGFMYVLFLFVNTARGCAPVNLHVY